MKRLTKYGLVLGLSTLLVTSSFTTPTFAVEKQANFVGQNQASQDQLTYEKNKLVVQTSKALTAKELKNLGATVSQKIPDLNYSVLQFKSEIAWKEAVKTLATNNSVQKIALSPIYKKMASGDPKASRQYMHTLLNSDQAQKLMGKNKVKVAVIDGGVDANSPDLKSQVIRTKNMVNPLYTSTNNSHGSHVAGIIAATKNNGVGGYGLNPKAQILGYDVFNGEEGAYDYIIAKAIIQATKDGAKIINLSLGSAYSSEIMADAITYAHSKNVTVIAAAGNEGTDDRQFPASYDGVISVGSVNAQKKRSVFSSFGVSTDIVAPGEDIYSTSHQKRGSTFEKMSGTSMAAPVVAGIASLILSKSPNLTPNQVEYILEKSATDLGKKGFDNQYGNGLVNPLAAMKFDSKKIPTLTSKKWTDTTILNDATDIRLNESLQASLTKPSEQQWVRVAVSKGQKIQVQAIGDEFADLKVAVNFYGENTSQKSIYNDSKEHEMEAPYFEVPFDGTMAIGISDINGLVSSSPYSLSINAGDFPDDESNRDEVVHIDTVNSAIEDQYFQPIEGGDEDVLHYKATKNELVEIELSALPGVKTAIQVFDEKGFHPKEEAKEDEYESGPFVVSNNTKSNSKNSVAFETKAGEDYYMVLSNIPTEEFTFEMLLQMLLTGKEVNFLNPTPKNSLLPYQVALKSKMIPADEDQLKMVVPSTEGMNSPEDEISFIDMQDQYEQQGLAFDLSKETKGFLNGSDDLDGYYFTTTSSVIYQLAIQTLNKRDVPLVNLYEVNYIENANGESEKSFDLVTDNYSEYLADGTVMKMALKANTTYLLEVSNQLNSRLPFEGYSLIPKQLKLNTIDKYEDNNSYAKATTFPSTGSLIGNFATFNDSDYFYYTVKQTGIYSIDYQMKNLTSTEKKALPESLRNRFISFVSIIEDKNDNRRLDDNETNSGLSFTAVQNDLSLHSSFEMNKGEHYFIVVEPQQFEFFSFSARPYELSLKPASTKDEDSKNSIKNNTPSKPISLVKKSARIYEKSAFLNPSQKSGDADWFVYNASTKGKISATLTLPTDLDGVLEIYKNGKRISKTDYYGDGDTEKITFNVSKGKYYFKVTDRLKRASVNSYKLTITK